MDAADVPCVQTIILCKCVQSGGSEAAHNFIGYSADRKSGPAMYVYPSLDSGKEHVVLPLENAMDGMRSKSKIKISFFKLRFILFSEFWLVIKSLELVLYIFFRFILLVWWWLLKSFISNFQCCII